MNQIMQEIENRLSYSYNGFRNGYYVFKNYDSINDKTQHHYYSFMPCDICEEPYLKKKYTKANKHRACSNRVTNNIRKFHNKKES